MSTAVAVGTGRSAAGDTLAFRAAGCARIHCALAWRLFGLVITRGGIRVRCAFAWRLSAFAIGCCWFTWGFARRIIDRSLFARCAFVCSRPAFALRRYTVLTTVSEDF